MSVDDAWDALSAALNEVTPPCDARPLFTAERLTDDQRAECASICARCPIADVCNAYASAAKVESGFWAGAERSPKRTKPSTTEPAVPGNQ